MIQPRDYQIIANNALFDCLNRRMKRLLVCMPTGTGKSILIAMFIYQVLSEWPLTRILAMTHVKELIKQNSDKLGEIWPTAPYGILSAGLKKKEFNLPIIFAGVATAFNNIVALGWIDIILVDEAHLMNGKDDSMYGEIINALLKLNPNLVVIGWTATPYRTNVGMLTESGIFTDIAIDMTTMKWFNWFIDSGYMSMLIPKRTNTTLDVSKVRITAGEFNQRGLEEAVDVRDINYLACKETCELGADRQSWLTFASGVKHAEHLAEMFRNFGIPTAAVHSKMKSSKRDTVIADFKSGKLRNLVNKGVFTTGQDHPPIDLICDLNPTKSTGLHVQKYGRGSRPFEGKINCLGLDFAGNVPLLGPINDPVIPRPKGTGAPGVAPIRICDQCGTYNHASARFCYVCGFEFQFQIHIQASAGTDEIIRAEVPLVEQFQVNRVLYNKFSKNSIGILRVNYVCGIRSFSEVVCLEHPGRAGHLAREWWKRRMSVDTAPPTVDEALLWVSKLAVPQSIHVVVNKKYPEVIKCTFAELTQ